MQQTLEQAIAKAHDVAIQAQAISNLSLICAAAVMLLVLLYAVYLLRCLAEAESEASYLRGRLDERDEQKGVSWIVPIERPA